MKRFLATFTLIIVALGVLNFSSFAFAADPPPAGSSSDQALKNMETFKTGTYLLAKGQQKPLPIGAYIVRLINFLSMVIGSFAFVAIVIGGIMMVGSGGQEQAISRGKDIIKYAIMGMVVAFSAFFITSFVQSIFYEYGT
ncbi:hypothetical protein IT413_05215 [Candidatus Peregrinibacteria bacterium]|nr:hypothetical protein [Candidatus Peregrinibacteria bacterium]